MSDNQILSTSDIEPRIKALTFECKFTVESSEGLCGSSESRRVTFEGYASRELYEALIEAIGKVGDAWTTSGGTSATKSDSCA